MDDRQAPDHHRQIDAEGPTADRDDPAVDWNRFARSDHLAGPADASGSLGTDRPHPRLPADAPLDPERRRVEVSGLHPDRLERARPDEQQALEAAYEARPTPETLAQGINPGYDSPDPADHRGRLTNCVDCARAFQEGIEGQPRVAARIDARGLPAAEGKTANGEHLQYLEQWAGARVEHTTYDQVARDVGACRGSAILMGRGDGGGHAFNAYWDDATDRVRWADAQAGTTGDWPPDGHAAQFPRLRAIVFDRGGRTG